MHKRLGRLIDRNRTIVMVVMADPLQMQRCMRGFVSLRALGTPGQSLVKGQQRKHDEDKSTDHTETVILITYVFNVFA